MHQSFTDGHLAASSYDDLGKSHSFDIGKKTSFCITEKKKNRKKGGYVCRFGRKRNKHSVEVHGEH